MTKPQGCWADMRMESMVLTAASVYPRRLPRGQQRSGWCWHGEARSGAGSLRLARQLEPLTAVLISVNRQQKTRSGLAIAGVEQD